MRSVVLILNLPFTLIGITPLIPSGPYQVKFINNPYALAFKVKSFWWYFWMKSPRATTIGHIILLSPKELKNDFEHEVIHVRQAEKYPVIFPLLYLYESIKHGYRQNRFEDEAYALSKSVYKGVKQG